jgi:adenylate kinase family enzyme
MIVCVMGPSGSGKSTLAKRLQELRPDLFARVPTASRALSLSKGI